MQVFKCELDSIQNINDEFRLLVLMLEDHKEAIANVNEYVITSAVKMIDFERGIAITRNNVYKWK